MAKDFNASQIRTDQVIASNASADQPGIIVVNYDSPGVDYSGSGVSNSTLMGSVGKDVFLFVSGTKGSAKTSRRGASLFGGDIVVSGTIVDASGSVVTGIGGSNTQVQFNDFGSFGGDSGFVYQKSTQTLTVGNLTVTGSITSVTSSNLVISDPLLYIASGGSSSNQNGGIAISSGSSTTDKALVIGRVANDTWGVGKHDVSGGTVVDLTSMTLVPLRTSKLEVGGQNSYITSSISTNLTMNATTIFASGVLHLSDELVIENNLLRIRSQSLGSRSSYIEAAGASDKITTRINGTDVLEIGKTTVIMPINTPLYFGGTSYISSTLINGTEFSATSLKVVGANGSSFDPSLTSDTFFFVSGSIGSKGTGEKGVAVFGGDVVISGTLHGGSPLKVSGSLGLSGSLRIASALVAPDVGANEAVLYVLDSLGTKKLYWKNGDGVQGEVGTGGGGASSGTFNEVPVSTPASSPPSLVTTSSVSISGGKGFLWSVESQSADAFFFVSGSIGSSNSTERGTAIFGGDVHISGSLSQGYQNKNTGDYSFAAGGLSEAVGIGSFVQGVSLIGSGAYQTVVGKYNDHSFSDQSSFVVGNGTPGVRSDLIRAYNQILEVTGTVSSDYLSGSLTKLKDGTSYLVAGNNVTIATGANGQVLISATGGVASNSYFTSDFNGAIYTTGSTSFSGNSPSISDPHMMGSNVSFFVSGTIGLPPSNGQSAISLFGGDLSSSGTIKSLTEISGTNFSVGSYQKFANLSTKPTINNTIDVSMYSVTGSLYMSSSNETEQKVLGSHCGGLYCYNNTVAQTLAPGVFEIVDWSSAGALAMTGSGNIVPSVSQNGLVLNKIGLFAVNIQMSFSGTAGSLYGVNAKLSSFHQYQVAFEKKINASNDIDSVGCTGLVFNQAAGTLLSAWVISNSSTFTIKTAQITATAV